MNIEKKMQETREEFEKLSKADQKRILEVLSLMGMLTEDQRQTAIELARMLAAYNTLSHTSTAGRNARS